MISILHHDCRLVDTGVISYLDLARSTLADWIWFVLLGYRCLFSLQFEIILPFYSFSDVSLYFYPSQ